MSIAHRRLFVAAMMMMAVGLAAGSAAALGQAADAGADDPRLIPYYNGNALCMRRLYTPAIVQYEMFLKAHPTHAKAPLAKWGLGLAYYSRFYSYDAAKRAEQRDDLTKAAELLGGLAGDAMVKDQEQLHNLWGACLLELNDFAKAETALAWSVKNAKTDERKIDAMAGLAQALFLQNKWDEVIKVTDDLLKAAPDSHHAPEARYQGGVARGKRKKYGPADDILSKLVEDTKDPSLKHRSIYHLAECRWHREDLADAAILYEAAAKKEKGVYSEHAQYNLGVVQFIKKEYAKAITELTAFLSQYPKSGSVPRAKLYLGRAYLESKDFPQAEATLKPLLAVNAVAAPSTLWLARTYMRQKKNADVETLLAAAATTFAKDPVLPELYYELATAQMNLAKFKEAAAVYGSAIAGGKGMLVVESLRLRAFCLHRAEQYAESLKLCDEFLTTQPKHPETGEVLFIKAENLTLLEKSAAALPVYERVVAIDADHRRAKLSLLRMGQTYYREKDWKACLGKLAPLLTGKAAGEAFDQIWYMAGACHFRLGAWDPAIAAFEKFITEKPEQPNADTALYNLSLAYQHKEQAGKAMTTLSTLVSTHPKSKHLQEALVELGRLQYEAKEYAAAKRTLLQVTAGGPPAAQYYLGWIALNQNDDAEAAKHFAAMAKHPKHTFAADAALQHAILQIRAKQYKEAETALTALLTGCPDYKKKDQVVYYRGLSLARQKLYANAVPDFVTVLTKHPKSDKADKALYWQAWCERSSEHAAAAVKLYESFLEKFPKSILANDVTVELSELEFEEQQKLESKKPAAPAPGQAVYATIANRLEVLLGPDKKKLADSALQNRALYLLGWCYFKRGEHGNAAVGFETMLASKHEGPLVPSALFQAGEARMKLREHGPALAHFTNAVAAGKTAVHEPALLRRAQCEAHTAKWPQSQQTAQLFLQTYPESKYVQDAQFALGWALENQGQHAAAIPVYQKVTAAGKTNEISARSQFQIGECLFAAKEYADAIPALILVETRYGYEKYTGKALLELGRVLEAQGKKTEAMERYEEVKTRFPKTPEAAVADNLLKNLTGSK
ncbi:MAG: tetratricopeptide repeat protein [Planctomycetota bacterium]